MPKTAFSQRVGGLSGSDGGGVASSCALSLLACFSRYSCAACWALPCAFLSSEPNPMVTLLLLLLLLLLLSFVFPLRQFRASGFMIGCGEWSWGEKFLSHIYSIFRVITIRNTFSIYD